MIGFERWPHEKITIIITDTHQEGKSFGTSDCCLTVVFICFPFPLSFNFGFLKSCPSERSLQEGTENCHENVCTWP